MILLVALLQRYVRKRIESQIILMCFHYTGEKLSKFSHWKHRERYQLDQF